MQPTPKKRKTLSEEGKNFSKLLTHAYHQPESIPKTIEEITPDKAKKAITSHRTKQNLSVLHACFLNDQVIRENPQNYRQKQRYNAAKTIIDLFKQPQDKESLYNLMKAKDNYSYTPFHYAAQYLPKIIPYIIEVLGKEYATELANLTNDREDTPLIAALYDTIFTTTDEYDWMRFHRYYPDYLHATFELIKITTNEKSIKALCDAPTAIQEQLIQEHLLKWLITQNPKLTNVATAFLIKYKTMLCDALLESKEYGLHATVLKNAIDPNTALGKIFWKLRGWGGFWAQYNITTVPAAVQRIQEQIKLAENRWVEMTNILNCSAEFNEPKPSSSP